VKIDVITVGLVRVGAWHTRCKTFAHTNRGQRMNHEATTGTWEDDELLSRMLKRETAAWREFHRRFDRLIYRCIHKVTCRFASVVSSEDVREIYCTLMVNLTARDMHKLRSFEPDRGNKLSSWVGLLATNTAWDHLRGVARRPQCAQLAEAEDLSATVSDPCEETLARERWTLVNETLQSFSSKDRRFVHLYYVVGLTPEQIAERMNISIKTVYSKKHKIRCRLEEALKQIADERTDTVAA
jgi:RNA polymerase sigma-70 factor (ECF subfamily)